MPVKFTWQPSNVATLWSSKQTELGLALGGDDKSIGSSKAGRVRLYEVAGKDDKGIYAKKDRLICTFHGKFHRDAGGGRDKVTFQLDGVNADNSTIGTPTNFAFLGANIRGFDPECMMGVDGFVMWFANRVFQVFLPFYLDSRSEGTRMELQAVAEAGGKKIARSGVLRLPIRRRKKVETTTLTGSGAAMTYTGNQMGCTILSHTDYLVDIGSTYRTINPARAGFTAYKKGALKIVLHPKLLAPGSGLCPGSMFLKSEFPHQTYPRFFNQIKKRIVTQMRKTLTHLFEDAGFAGVKVLTDKSKAGRSALTTFDGAFRKRSKNHPWTLRGSRKHLETPWWTWYIVPGFQSGTPSWVGLGQGIVLTTNGLTYPHGKVGHGKKQLERPLQVMTKPFREQLQNAVREKVEPREVGTWWSRDEFDDCVDGMATKVCFVVAHEIAHSLGMMHASILERDGKCTEDMFKGKRGTLTIMTPSTDQRVNSMSSVIDVRFANQSKVIWSQAFGVKPNFKDESLKNKTWKSAKKSWTDRIKAFKKKYKTKYYSKPKLIDTNGKPPSWAGAKKQRGAHFK